MAKSVQGIVGSVSPIGGLTNCKTRFRTSKPKLTRAEFFAVLAVIRREME
jgi:hypothetical protein